MPLVLAVGGAVELDAPAPFVWALFAVTVLGAALRLRFESREDHIVLTIAATVAAAILGLAAIPLVWAAVIVAMPLVGVWSLLPANRDRLGLAGARRSMVWMVISAFATTIGFLVGNLVYVGGFGRTYPATLTTLPDILSAGVAVTVAWLGAMSVRMLSLRAISGPILRRSLDPLDSVLVPYLMPLMGGFPLIVASVALYRPEDPWPAVFILWWCFPLYAATAFDLHRRRLAQELRRDLVAKQRLAAIGEVSARIVHQSRHQVGLMGWSIHRLRGLIGRTGAGEIAAAEAELDTLADVKERLVEMLASELLYERVLEDGVEGAGRGSTESVDLAAVAVEVVTQLQAKATARGVSCSVEAPPGAGHQAVPASLRDVVFNLVDNAIDAARHVVVVTIGGDGGDDGDLATVVITDDGPGVPAEDAGRVFEPFFTTKGEGTGMGLAIAEAVVGDLGGDLRHERAEGRTSFVVTVPIRKERTQRGNEATSRHRV